MIISNKKGKQNEQKGRQRDKAILLVVRQIPRLIQKDSRYGKKTQIGRQIESLQLMM